MNISVTGTSKKLNELLSAADLIDLKANRLGAPVGEITNMIITNNGTDIVYIDVRKDKDATITTAETPIAVGSKFSIEKYLIDEIYLISAGTSAVSIIG